MTLKALILAVSMLPIFHEDRPVTPEKERQLAAVASAIHAAARTPDEAAFLVAWGQFETAYSLRIHAGNCRKWECDRGKARGPWQVHRRASMTGAEWDRMHGIEHIREQAAYAAAMTRWALRQCPGNRIRGAFRVLGGRGCQSAPRPTEDARVAAFEKARRKIR